MKTKRIILGLWILVAGGCMLSSCTKNNYETIALIGTEYYIPNPERFLDSILSVIPTSQQTQFKAVFGSIPESTIPPKIEGSYVVARKECVSSNAPNWSPNIVENNMWLRFSSQHNGIAKMEMNEMSKTVIDTVFVCGKENAFAVYFIENSSFDVDSYHLEVKRGIIMKGLVTDEGISDFRYANIIMDVKTDTPSVFQEPGTYYIYKDGDGLAANEEW